MFWIIDIVLWFVFFFKQKTSYEMRISDWSSDVCSSDLLRPGAWTRHRPRLALAHARLAGVTTDVAIEPMWAIEMYASRLPLGDVQQVLAVVVLAQRLGEAAEVVGGDGALSPGDLLPAGDLQLGSAHV